MIFLVHFRELMCGKYVDGPVPGYPREVKAKRGVVSPQDFVASKVFVGAFIEEGVIVVGERVSHALKREGDGPTQEEGFTGGSVDGQVSNLFSYVPLYRGNQCVFLFPKGDGEFANCWSRRCEYSNFVRLFCRLTLYTN